MESKGSYLSTIPCICSLLRFLYIGFPFSLIVSSPSRQSRPKGWLRCFSLLTTSLTTPSPLSLDVLRPLFALPVLSSFTFGFKDTAQISLFFRNSGPSPPSRRPQKFFPSFLGEKRIFFHDEHFLGATGLFYIPGPIPSPFFVIGPVSFCTRRKRVEECPPCRSTAISTFSPFPLSIRFFSF